MNTVRMADFLAQVSQAHPAELIVMVLDGASSHQAKDLTIPDNIRLLALPSYAPQLNPQEHIWDELREKEFPNRVFNHLDGVIRQLEQGLPRMANDVGGTYSEYVFNIQGEAVGINNRTNWTEDYIPMSQGRHVAHYAAGAHFMHPDALGTTGIVTSYTGAVEQDELHYPWGQEWTMMGSMKEERYARLHHRDSESDLDPTHFRMYSSGTGRWMTPDPASEASANPLSPQSFNRYGYVTGNPLKRFDPFGLGGCDNMGGNNLGWGSWCGGDNGAPDCIMDGMYTPCNTVKSAVQSGFAVGCGNSCGPNTVYEGNLTTIQNCNATTEGWSCTQTPPTYLGTSLQQFQAGYYGQLGANVAAMDAMGFSPTDIGNFINANNNPPSWAGVQLGGGNFDFPYSPMYTGVSCASERCDLGSLGTLDFSHNNGTVHLDSGDPYNFPSGTFTHGWNDVIGGNTWWGSGIPR